MDTKPCAICRMDKALDEFHRQPRGPKGRHSYCRDCYAARRPYKNRATTEQRRKWNFSGRYGLTEAEVEAMRVRQDNRCAICEGPLRRPCVDHSHATGTVRGLLCHGCNIKLAAIEDETYMRKALRYLEQYRLT